jgi:hypothetical protein
VCKSVLSKRYFEKVLYKDANNIWVLGKNNFDRLEDLSVASDTDKSSCSNFRDYSQKRKPFNTGNKTGLFLLPIE